MEDRCMESVMSLPARELRVLSGIEAALQAGETRLTSMFAIFTRLATDEGKPGTEDLGIPSRNLWPASVPAAALRRGYDVGLRTILPRVCPCASSWNAAWTSDRA